MKALSGIAPGVGIAAGVSAQPAESSLVKRVLAASALLLWCLTAAAAPTAPAVRAEIDALLTKLQTSGCQFNRNGSWYGGAEAKEHLLRKLEYLEGKTTLRSAEQFIELGASQSSMSGRAYLVKCGAESPVSSELWLKQQLKAMRAAARQPRRVGVVRNIFATRPCASRRSAPGTVTCAMQRKGAAS